MLKKIYFQALHPDVPSIILDVLNLADAITSQVDNDEVKDRSNFCAIVKDCEKVILKKNVNKNMKC